MKKIIFDHDLGSDCDDAGAAAILIKAHKAGECKCLAITHMNGDHYGAYCIQAICEYFNVHDIEIGYNLENDKLSEPRYHACTKETAEKYFQGREFPVYESNVKLIRRLLANNGAKDITLVTTGPLSTIYELYKSGPDEISPKTGRELVQDSVSEFVCGGCCFEEQSCREWNIIMDMEGALDVINNPAVPMVFVGHNVGESIMTGAPLRDYDENYPVRDCYFSLTNWYKCIRNSWDLVVMYYAIYGGDEYWECLDGYDIKILNDGKTDVKEGGMHSYIRQIGNDQEITDILNKYMMP